MNLQELRSVVEADDFTMAEFTAEELPAAVYHAGPGLDKSAMIPLLKSPKHYRHYMATKADREISDEMRIGSLVHLAILEPDKFEHSTMLWLPASGTGSKKINADKRARAEQEGIELLTAAERARILGSRDAVLADPWVAEHIADCRLECSLYLRTRGVLLKCRADMIHAKSQTVIDIKTISDISTAGVQKSLANRDYHIQDALYSDVANLVCGFRGAQDFVFVFVESRPPHDVRVGRITGQAFDSGRVMYQAAISRYLECVATDEWPGTGGRPGGIEVWDLPTYKYYQEGM